MKFLGFLAVGVCTGMCHFEGGDIMKGDANHVEIAPMNLTST